MDGRAPDTAYSALDEAAAEFRSQFNYALCPRVLKARTADPDPEVRYRARQELAELCRDRHACPFQRDLPGHTVRGALRSASALR